MVKNQNIIYTVGYSGLNLADLVKVSEKLDAQVLDIRFRAGSRKPDWNKSALISALGNRYVRLREFGNVNYKIADAPVELLNPDVGIKLAGDILVHHSVILLCACADYTVCHRKDAAELLAETTNNPIRHLTLDGIQRLVAKYKVDSYG